MDEKELIAEQLRRGVHPHEVMNQYRARHNPTMPWNHDFQPDPLTPTACVIEGLHPAWHRDHQPR